MTSDSANTVPERVKNVVVSILTFFVDFLFTFFLVLGLLAFAARAARFIVALMNSVILTRVILLYSRALFNAELLWDADYHRVETYDVNI